MKKFFTCTLSCILLWWGLPFISGSSESHSAEKAEFYEQVYLSESNALKQIFGELTPEKRSLNISPAQKTVIQKRLRRKIPEKKLNLWVGLRNGKAERYAFILDEDGKHFPITFIVGLTPQAKITEVAVMVYRERRGDGVKRSRFLNQFKGKSGKDPLEINTDIIHLTGSTISSWSIAAGVRKAIVLLEELVLK